MKYVTDAQGCIVQSQFAPRDEKDYQKEQQQLVGYAPQNQKSFRISPGQVFAGLSPELYPTHRQVLASVAFRLHRAISQGYFRRLNQATQKDLNDLLTILAKLAEHKDPAPEPRWWDRVKKSFGG